MKRPNVVGISYIIPSESKQKGCAEYPVLPPLTIRPHFDPGESGNDGAEFSNNLGCLISGKTLMSSFHASDETLMKKYLLYPEQRKSILEGHASVVRNSNSLEDVLSSLSDRMFLCLHFLLEQDASKSYCIRSLSMDDESGLEHSNLQVTITVKKGVGGTFTMKNEAKEADESGLLSLILGENPVKLVKLYKEQDMKLSQDQDSAMDEKVAEERLVPAEKKLGLSTSSCRIEMFLDRNLWSSMNR